MSRPTNSFTTLAGVATHYARQPVAPYGTRGKPYTFYCDANFQAKLEDCFEEMWSRNPHGTPEVITSAGAYVSKPGQHSKGKAFDLDAIFWPNREFVTLRYPTDKPFYLGVEAICKKHFGTVLGYNYNSDRKRHLSDLLPLKSEVS